MNLSEKASAFFIENLIIKQDNKKSSISCNNESICFSSSSSSLTSSSSSSISSVDSNSPICKCKNFYHISFIFKKN
jgi:hypothetical protein